MGSDAFLFGDLLELRGAKSVPTQIWLPFNI